MKALILWNIWEAGWHAAIPRKAIPGSTSISPGLFWTHKAFGFTGFRGFAGFCNAVFVCMTPDPRLEALPEDLNPNSPKNPELSKSLIPKSVQLPSSKPCLHHGPLQFVALRRAAFWDVFRLPFRSPRLLSHILRPQCAGFLLHNLVKSYRSLVDGLGFKVWGLPSYSP